MSESQKVKFNCKNCKTEIIAEFKKNGSCPNCISNYVFIITNEETKDEKVTLAWEI